MNKNLFLSSLFTLFFVTSCSQDDSVENYQTELKKEESSGFFTFSDNANAKSKSSNSNFLTAMKYSYLLQRYDRLHKTNLSGLVNSSNSVKYNRENKQNFIEENKDFYIETRVYSQVLEEENGDQRIIFPKIKDNKVEGLMVGLLSKNKTDLRFYFYDKNTTLYKEFSLLFQTKYNELFNSSLQSRTRNGLCGYGSEVCELGGVIVRPNPGGSSWPGGGGSESGGGTCPIYNDCDNSNGENNTGDANEPVNVVQALVDKPFAFIDVPCDVIKEWLKTARHQVAQAQLDKLNQITRSHSVTTAYGSITHTTVANLQHINNAYSKVVNLDYFPITVNQLPVVNGTRLTPEQFLNQIRKNINSFVDTSYSEFEPYHWYGVDDRKLWNSSNPLGTVIAIDIEGPDNGSVMVTDYASDHWTFSTIFDPKYGVHPVSGHRDFGFERNANGSYTFYTRGVDRLSDVGGGTMYEISEYFNSSFPLSRADALWKSFQNKISNYVNSHGGRANVSTPQIERPDWQKVKDVLDGKKPLSTLSNDCK
jgi:hypothetical protein